MKKYLRLILKFGISASLMIYIIMKIEFDEIHIEISLQTILFFLIAVLITVSNNFFAALRLNKVIPRNTPLMKLTKVNFIGSFFNMFMPTNFGGDVLRIRYLKPKLENYSQATAVIFIDRFIGLTLMLTFAVVGLMYLAVVQDTYLPVYIYAVVACATVINIVLWFSIFSDTLLAFVNNIKQIDKLNSAHQYILRNKKSDYLQAFIWATILQFNVVMFNYFLSRAAGLEIPFYYFFSIIPITNLFLMIPVTINGIGMRDTLFVSLFKTAQSSSNIVLLAPLNLLGNSINACIGGVIYALTDREQLWKDTHHNNV